MTFACELLSELGAFFSKTHLFVKGEGFYGSFFAALSVALIFFLIKEFLNPARKINGDFFVYSKTKISCFNPYIEMTVERNIILYSDGKCVKGTSEKTREKALNKDVFEYKTLDRVRGDIEGYVERRYIRSSKLHLHLIEDNKKSRESTSYVQINLGWGLCLREKIKGEFYSTAADSRGDIVLCKKRLDLGSI